MDGNEAKVKRTEDADGWRWYEIEGLSDKFISVTKVLDCVVHERLQNWFKSKGPKAIETTSSRAKKLGTEHHSALEKYLKTGEVAKGYEDFIEAWSVFCLEHGIAVDYFERMLYSPTLGVAGTADMIGTIKGKPMIGDLKTGRTYNIKTGHQLAAYKFMHEELTGTTDTKMIGIHAQSFSEGKYNIRLFEYEHDLFCLQRFLCALEAWKGLYFSKLAKMNWKWLHEYSVNQTFGVKK